MLQILALEQFLLVKKGVRRLVPPLTSQAHAQGRTNSLFRHWIKESEIFFFGSTTILNMQPIRAFPLPNPRRRGRSSPPTPSGHDNHSQIDEASSASSSQAADSMRPLAPPARKRRRTILDAFQSIQIQNEEEEDADSSQAVDIEGEDVSDSTIEDEESQDDRLLSDREEAERKVMLELVLGPASKPNPVDQKVAAMVRASLRQAAADPNGPTVATTVSTHRDDMHIETAYSRSSSANLPPPAPLERSNSLPDMALVDHDSMDMT